MICNEIAAIPSTTVTPDNPPSTATAAGVVHTPIPIQHNPISAQTVPASGTGANLRTTASEIIVPTTEPIPYPDIPAARYTPGCPRSAPITDNPSVNENHVRQPAPRAIQP